MQDDDPEEDYHAQFMKSAAEQAGIRCKLIRGMEGLDWDAEGFVVDAEGERILWVWKTWAWETALDQLRAECDEDETLAAIGDQQVKSTVPRLVDVLLRQEVMVYEPLWTLIPSNKAILPVLWQLFPDHPNLLESHYSLNQELQGRGYVTKPIAGRCGHNISIVDGNNAVLEETGGRFSEQDQIYQALCKLPVLGKFNVQLATYTVAGKYSAASVRVDTSPVITTHSDLLPLRILQDERFV
jgi:glutathionylspermidine amidase/synthetase